MSKKSSDLFTFWDELKRRKVVKATLVYLAVAYAILQASSIIFPALGFPGWTITFILILLIIVFILVIVLTWVYDITPEGIKVTQTLAEDAEEKVKEKSPDKVESAGLLTKSETGQSEGDLQKKILTLENKLKEASQKEISARELLRLGFKKLLFPVLIIIVVLLIVFNKQKLVHLIGIGDAKRKIAMTHNANATIYIRRGDLEAAGRELELAVASDPGYSYAWSNMAVVSYRLGDLDKAVIQVIKAISLDPKNSKAPFNLAYALDDKKDYNQAIRWYKEAIRIDSIYRRDTVFTASCSALGRLYNSISQPVDAILILNRAADQFPGSRYNYLIFKNLGNAYLLQQQTDSALKYLERSKEISPLEPETNLFLAKAYEAAGKLSKSIEVWESYIELEADTGKITDAKKHQKELAVRQLQEIIK